MKLKGIKIFAIAIMILPMLAIAAFDTRPVGALVTVPEDTAVTYKTKCAACHTPKADKFFDPSKSDEEHIAVIMNGRKGAKPPFMPGFEAKGMTPNDAKALAEYMKKLRTTAN